MSRAIPTSSTPWYARAPMLVAIVIVIAGGAALAFLLTRSAGGASGNGETVQYVTEQGENQPAGTVDSPLRVVLRLPWSDGSSDTAVASVALLMVDASGAPATFGGVPMEQEAMKPALEIGVWVLDGSVPGEPGEFHPRMKLQMLNGPERDIELSGAVLKAEPVAGEPLHSGYVFARTANLWLMSTDLQRQRRVTFYSPFYEYADSPEWSPDGKLLAYAYSPKAAQDQLPYTDIWTMNGDGSGKHALATHGTNESLFDPAWSADGKSVYFAVQTSTIDSTTTELTAPSSETWRIDRVDVGSGARSTLIPDAQMPDVSAAAQKLIYVALQPDTDPNAVTANKVKLVIAGLDGSAPTTLVGPDKYQSIYGPTVSPDGKWVAFAAIAPISTTPATPTTPSGFDFFNWLMLGGTARAHGLPWELFMVSTSGGEPVQLTHLTEDQPHAVWLDNSTIVFNGSTGMYKLKLDGKGAAAGEPEKVHEGSPHGGLSWHAP